MTAPVKAPSLAPLQRPFIQKTAPVKAPFIAPSSDTFSPLTGNCIVTLGYASRTRLPFCILPTDQMRSLTGNGRRA
jgi:hypothetical protein